MDWARKIRVSDGELMAEIEVGDGRLDLTALTELAKRGTPALHPTVRKQLNVRFEDFVHCSSHEYITQFGKSEAERHEDYHRVYRVLSGGKCYLVPALVMLRALFRPNSTLLPLMFAPNALERTCRLDCSGEEVHVIVDAPWTNGHDARGRSDWETPLRWMMLHPSARRMADSVHQHAMSGRIAVDLPEGNLEVVFAGVQGASAVLVTEVRILAVTPLDMPDLPVVTWAPRFEYVNRSWAVGRNLRESVSADVPLRVDGTHELTDEEWIVIGPLLVGQYKKHPTFQHCQRKLLDGILGKLATGKSWRESSYKVGDWRNAATSYRRWTSSGTFSEAMQALRSMR